MLKRVQKLPCEAWEPDTHTHTHTPSCLRQSFPCFGIWLKALLLHFIQAWRCETLLTAAGSRHPRERIEKYINRELSILGQVWWMSSFCRDFSLAEGRKLRKYCRPVHLNAVSLWKVPLTDAVFFFFFVRRECDITVMSHFLYLPDGTFIKSQRIYFTDSSSEWGTETGHRL